MREERLIHPISLRIIAAGAREEYRKQSIEGSLFQFRFAYVMAMIAFAFFIVVDYFSFPKHFHTYLNIRLYVIFPILILCLIMTFTKLYLKYAIWLNVIAVIVSGFSLVIMTVIGHDEPYGELRFVSLILVLFFLYSFFKLSYIHSLILGLVITAFYMTFDAYFQINEPRGQWAVTGYFLAANCIGVAIAYLIEYQTKKEFLLKRSLSENVIKDALTGLYNRHYFDQVLKVDIENFIARSKGVARIEQRLGDIKTAKYGLFMVDIDFFKRINDNFGHYSGDLVLKQFSEILQGQVRRSDAVLRVGGEEFLIVLKLTSDDYLLDFMKKLGRVIEEYDFVVEGGRIIGCTVSMGMVVMPSTRTDDVNELMKYADRALYRSKDNGRNRGHRAYELQGEVEFEEILWDDQGEEDVIAVYS